MLPIGRIIAALLLPPLAVFLEEGVSRDFWIAIGLTCLAFIPGIIFAFFVLMKKQRSRPQPA
jgi:uncharacterized membrane protein YqaE (UPF0057 family)